MNGPEHYREAENQLRLATGATIGSEEERYGLAAAQVHATLALAAAQAEQVVADALSHPNWVNASQWEIAIKATFTTEGAPF